MGKTPFYCSQLYLSNEACVCVLCVFCNQCSSSNFSRNKRGFISGLKLGAMRRSSLPANACETKGDGHDRVQIINPYLFRTALRILCTVNVININIYIEGTTVSAAFRNHRFPKYLLVCFPNLYFGQNAISRLIVSC